MRLKYPGSLSRLYSNASASRTAFGFAFCTSAPVLIAGLGIFLPHGESVSTDIVARWGPRRPQVKTKTTDSLIKSALFCPRWPKSSKLNELHLRDIHPHDHLQGCRKSMSTERRGEHYWKKGIISLWIAFILVVVLLITIVFCFRHQKSVEKFNWPTPRRATLWIPWPPQPSLALSSIGTSLRGSAGTAELRGALRNVIKML